MSLNFDQFNRALLGKWLWRYAMEREALWRLVIEAKYESMRGGWCSNEVMGTYGVGVWKHIRKGWDKFSNVVQSKKKKVFQCCPFEVGVGSKVSFLHDHWCGDRPLKLSYSALCSIARCKDAWVANNMLFQDGISQNVIFTRPVEDWEIEPVLSFFERLYSFHLQHGEEDRLGWSPCKRGKFEVNS
jgi:hypothetical protein